VVLVAPEMPESESPVTLAADDEPMQGRTQVESVSAPAESSVPEETAPPLVLHGRVLFPDGSGAAGATVVLGELSTGCDAHGRFALEIVEREGVPLLGRVPGIRSPSLDDDAALVALLAGWTPGVLAGVGARVRAAHGERPRAPLEPVEIVLTDLAETIDGTVLGRDGAPASDWRIALLDGVPAFAGDYRPFSAEELSSGVRDHATTDAHGRFAFTGLVRGKEYRVRAWNPQTLEQVTSEPLPSGTREHVLRMPGEGLRPLVDGLIVGLDGTPLEGMRCRLTMVEYRLEHEGTGRTWMTTGQEVHTDALGRFEFRDVPACPLFVRIDGQGTGTRLDLPPEEPCRGLRVELARAGSFTLEIGDPAHAPDALRALDADGELLRMERDTGPGSSEGGREMDLPPDGAHGWRVSERARWLVLVEDGAERARLPVSIRHGRTAHLRW
jgi:hypothetical protein